MKRVFLLTMVLFCIQSIIFSQVAKGVAKEVLTQEIVVEKSFSKSLLIEQETYPICGTPELIKKEQEIIDYLREHPEERTERSLAKPAWNFNVGDTWPWWAYSWVTEEDYQVPSTCRAVGTNCYIFVADASWSNGEVDQTAVDAIVNGFDSATPAFPSKGIFQVDTETFGDPPNVDSDTKIIILILDIDDGWSGSGGYIAGYFSSANEFPEDDPAIGDRETNFAEIFYMDSNPADLLSESGRTRVLNTTAHEFQHMIHYNYDPGESAFINEGLSEIASYICGYGVRSSAGYAGNPNVYLFGWDLEGNVLNDYSRAALFTLYIHEQFPDGILKKIAQHPNNTNYGLDGAFGQIESNRKYRDTFEDWIIANHLQDKSVDPEWGYDYSPISKPNATTHYITTATGSGIIKKLAAEYITFAGGTPFKITFTGNIKIKVIKTGPSGTVVETVTKDEEYDIPDFSTIYTEVTFVVYRNSAFGSDEMNYSYVAVGSGSGPQTIELAYDDGIPVKPLKLTENDTMTVQFNGIAGGIIDSLKVGFKNAGDIIYGVNKFTGGYRIAGGPFGQVLVPAQNLNVPTSSNSLDPFDNWINIDLSSQNIDGSDDFIIYFVVGSDNQVPGLMASAEEDDGLIQYTFLNDPTNPPPDWFRLVDDNDNIWKYLVHAYVTINKSAITAPASLLAAVNQGNVQLSWDASSGPVEGYNIYRSTVSGFIPDAGAKIVSPEAGNKIASVGSAVTNYTDAWPSIQPNTDYFYKVSSYDAGENEEFSEEVSTTTLSISDNSGLPAEYRLDSNYPNPFNPSTTFRFSTLKDGLVKFTVHDLLGRVVYSEYRNLFAGNYSFAWEGNNMLNQQVVSGVYFLRMEAEGFSQTRKMLLLR